MRYLLNKSLRVFYLYELKNTGIRTNSQVGIVHIDSEPANLKIRIKTMENLPVIKLYDTVRLITTSSGGDNVL